MQAFQRIKVPRTVFSYEHLFIAFLLVTFISQSCYTFIKPSLVLEHFRIGQEMENRPEWNTAGYGNRTEGKVQQVGLEVLEFAALSANDHGFGYPDRFVTPVVHAHKTSRFPKRAYLAISIIKESNYRSVSLWFYRSEIQSINIDSQRVSLISTLENATKNNNEISFLALFSHGSPNSIWGDGGIYIQTQDLDGLQFSISNGKTKFSKDAVIYLGGCNSGTEHKGRCFAQKLADVTGATVYALVDDSVKPIRESKGELSYPKMVYGPQHNPGSQFNIFTPNSPSRPLGHTLDLVKLFDKTRIAQDGKDWEDEIAAHRSTADGERRTVGI